MTTMSRTRNSRSDHYASRFYCGVCEISEFTEGYATEEERQAHWTESGHGPVQEWLTKHGRSADAILAEQQINRSFPGATDVTDEYRRPGARMSGRTYGVGDELVTKQQRRQAEEIGISVAGQSRKAAAKKINAARMASEKQARFITRLVSERKGNPAIDGIRGKLNQSFNETGRTNLDDGTPLVSFEVARSAISDLLAIPVGAVAESAEVATTPSEPRSGARRIVNKFPKKCRFCDVVVEAGEGTWEIDDEGNKSVYHREGQCPMVLGVPNGHYAFEIDGVMKFYEVNTTGLFAQASDNLHRIKAKEYIDQVVELIKADPLAAMKRYGVELGRCGRCHRKLTSEWRKVGVGPVCNEKGF